MKYPFAFPGTYIKCTDMTRRRIRRFTDSYSLDQQVLKNNAGSRAYNVRFKTRRIPVEIFGEVNKSILTKISYPEIPPRVEYELTAFGQRFIGILDAINALEQEVADDASLGCAKNTGHCVIGRHFAGVAGGLSLQKLQGIRANDVQ